MGPGEIKTGIHVPFYFNLLQPSSTIVLTPLKGQITDTVQESNSKWRLCQVR